MRISRVTWTGAFHHVMTRGHEGRRIFELESAKQDFLRILGENVRLKRIRLLAYCILDNHYHLVLENSTGHMSEMMKEINGQYSSTYRKNKPGRGTIYQDRFKSTLIESNAYLVTSIMYALFNPVRAGIVSRFSQYPWSSAGELLINHPVGLTDQEFVLDLFGDRDGFLRQMDMFDPMKKMETKWSRFGEILGGNGFVSFIESRFNRRHRPDAVKRRRYDDRCFEPLDKVIQEFAALKGINPDTIDMKTIAGKRLRGELLVNIRERCGLSYSEILELPFFSDIQPGTMGSLYWHAKRRMKVKD